MCSVRGGKFNVIPATAKLLSSDPWGNVSRGLHQLFWRVLGEATRFMSFSRVANKIGWFRVSLNTDRKEGDEKA